MFMCVFDCRGQNRQFERRRGESMSILRCGEYDASGLLRSGRRRRQTILLAIAMIVNAIGDELGRLWRAELIEKVVHSMGRRENQEKQQ